MSAHSQETYLRLAAHFLRRTESMGFHVHNSTFHPLTSFPLEVCRRATDARHDERDEQKLLIYKFD